MKNLFILPLVALTSVLVSCNGCKNPQPTPRQTEILSTIVFEGANGSSDSLALTWHDNYGMLGSATGYINVTIDTIQRIMAYSQQSRFFLHHISFRNPTNGTLINTITCDYDGYGNISSYNNVVSSAGSHFQNIGYHYTDYLNVISKDSAGGPVAYYAMRQYADSPYRYMLQKCVIIDSVRSATGAIDTSIRCELIFDSVTTGDYANATGRERYTVPALWLLECTWSNSIYKFSDYNSALAMNTFSTRHIASDYASGATYPVKTQNYYRHDTLTASYNYSYIVNVNGHITQKTITDNITGKRYNTQYRYKMMDTYH